MRSIVAVFLFLAIAILIPGTLVLIWLGFVPGLSVWIGINKVKDLGITYSDQDLVVADQKRGSKAETFLISNDEPKETLNYVGKVSVNSNHNSAEVTAIFNRWAKNWRYFPLSEIQVKINENGTIEVAARLLLGRIAGYAEAMGREPKETESLLIKLNSFKVNPVIYLKGTAVVIDNELTLEIRRLEIGRLPIPLAMFGKKTEEITQIIQEDWINSVPGCILQSVGLRNSLVFIKGSYPAVELMAN